MEELRGRERTRAVSGARRLFVHKALIENELRASGHLLEIITRPYGSVGTSAANPHPLVAPTIED